MALQLKKATRTKQKLRIGIFGPSGSGKTYSSLMLAYGLVGDWSKIALIDTERGSGDLYDHLGEYNTVSLGAPFQPERYIEAIDVCLNAGMEAIIIDSISHEWDGPGGIIEIKDSMTGNSFTNWAKLTPRHNRFIDKILSSGAHMICCGRSKQDYVLTEVEKHGKKTQTPQKVGMKSVTRDGFDYEMTLCFDLNILHWATASKDRTGLFVDKPEHVISEETGQLLMEWVSAAKDAPPEDSTKRKILIDRITTLKNKLELTPEAARKACGVSTLQGASLATLEDVLDKLQIVERERLESSGGELLSNGDGDMSAWVQPLDYDPEIHGPPGED